MKFSHLMYDPISKKNDIHSLFVSLDISTSYKKKRIKIYIPKVS
jgi:hypothetical protein